MESDVKARPDTDARRFRPRLGLDRFSALYLWVAFIIIYAFWVPKYFLAWATAHSIASSQSVSAIVALAVLVPLAAGVYDLSIGATTNLCTVFVSTLQVNNHMSAWQAAIVVMLTAVAIGIVNGLLVVRFHINSFVATLGMSVVITAFQGIVSGESQPNAATGSAWLALTQHTVFGFQIVIVYVIVLAVLVWWFLDHTPAGRYIYATGSNREASRLSGVRVGKWEFITLVISAGLCGLGGILYASLDGPSLTFGSDLLLPAFAAVFLGSTQLKPGRVNTWGTIIAVFVLATGVEGLELLTGVQWLNEMFSGVALIVAVGFAVSRQGRVAQSQVVLPEDDWNGPDSIPSPGSLGEQAGREARKPETAAAREIPLNNNQGRG